MKSVSDIERELRMLGIHIRFWGKPEVKELAHILTDEEHLTTAATGRYQGGFALIVTTNHRLLLIDKKMWFMSLEDTRFDMITEVDYSARLFDATINVRTINKVLTFTSMNQAHLRNLSRYLQERIMELRQMMMQQAQVPPAQAASHPDVPVEAQNFYQQQPQVQFQPQPSQTYVSQSSPLQEPIAPAPIQPAQAPTPVTNAGYTRPGRLRRMGAFPTASFTMTSQRYITGNR